MNLVDWIVIVIIAILLVAAVIYSRKNSCSGDCGSCQTNCSKKDPGEVPDWVKRYRKDHPKQHS